MISRSLLKPRREYKTLSEKTKTLEKKRDDKQI